MAYQLLAPMAGVVMWCGAFLSHGLGGEIQTTPVAGGERHSPNPASAAATPADVAPTGDELVAAAKRAVRLSKSAKTTDERRSAARKLVQTLVAIRADESLSIRVRYDAYHLVRNRLLAVEQGLRSELNRERANLAIADPAETSPANPAQPAQINLPPGATALGQQLGAPGAIGAPPASGQPAGLAAGRQPPDDGERLLELIQTVIHPNTWDINGGPSSGFYYRPLHALVISAPSEVHGEVGGVLGGLRK